MKIWQRSKCSALSLSQQSFDGAFGEALGPDAGRDFQAGQDCAALWGLLLLAYGVGHCVVIVAAVTSTEMVQRFLNWNEHSKGLAGVKIICGVLVLLGGVWLIYSA